MINRRAVMSGNNLLTPRQTTRKWSVENVTADKTAQKEKSQTITVTLCSLHFTVTKWQRSSHDHNKYYHLCAPVSINIDIDFNFNSQLNLYLVPALVIREREKKKLIEPILNISIIKTSMNDIPCEWSKPQFYRYLLPLPSTAAFFFVYDWA